MPPTITAPSTETLAKVKGHRATKSAQIMMVDAFDIVETGHHKSVKNFFKHSVSQGVRTMSTADRISTGTGLAITGAVAIAGLATGGLAIPILIGLGAGAWALKKAISEIGNDINRQNRNWLQRFSGQKGADSKEHAAMLTCEAGDAIRRGIDHYRMMVNTIIPQELKPQDEGQYANCEDVINHVKAVARFIHHGDKVRNYALPALDLLIFYLEQYEKMAEQWATWETSFDAGLKAWFVGHGSGSCAGTDVKNVCYAPNASTGTFPIKPHASGKSNRSLPTGADWDPAPGAVDIAELVAAMKKAKEKVIAGMHVSSSKTWNYSAERPATSRVSSGSHSSVHMAKRRLDLMIDAVWQQVDRPGYFARAGRRVSHWYTRHNKTEKIGAIFSEVVAVGSIFLPFIKGADKLSDLAKSAISGSVSGTTVVADKIGMGLLKTKGQAPIKLGLLSAQRAQEAADADVRGSGVTIQKLMPKLMTHFGNAAEVLKELGESASITSCNQAFGLALRAGEFVHEMNKVNRYIEPCIGLVDYLCNAADKWYDQEDEIWRFMEQYAFEWVSDEDIHQICREANKKCYGPKYRQTGGGLFSRTAVTWHLLTNDPHNPL
ncbi:MAG: hypothetical protein FJ027_21600 [Candidatus Rokubacteria bacterium]|nr:hypothetical protein [Candidatus Rokubacteria bacterium]